MKYNTYLRKDRGAWRAVAIPCDGPDRSQKTKTMLSRKKADATREMELWRAELESKDDEPAETISELEPGFESVGDHVSKFIESLAASGLIEESTLSGYRCTVKHISKAWPSLPYELLTAEDVLGLEAEMKQKDYSPSAIIKVHRMVNQVYKADASAGKIPRNPLEGIRAPKKRNKKQGINALTAEGARRLIDKLDAMELTNATVGVRIALNTGAREGEVSALRWVDVDYVHRIIKIRRAVGRTTGSTYLKEAKNDHARDVPLNDGLASVLKSWRKLNPSTTYILERNGSYMNPNTLGKQWKTLSEALGIVGTEGRICTFHDLRHSYATICVAEHVDVKSLQSILDHSSSSFTIDTYVSVDPIAKQQAGDAFYKAISR